MKRAVFVVGVALLGITAAPAQATLRVESSSTGLTVLDKNGFANTLTITAATQGGNPVYLLVTDSFDLDFVKYEFGPNCSAGATGDKAVCKRLSGKINMNMAGGSDDVFVGDSGATSVTANLGTFKDEYHGISGPDDVFTGSGDDEVDTGAGDDDVTLASGSDQIRAGSGNDRIDLSNPSSQTGDAFVSAGGGPGDDSSTLPTPCPTRTF